jgi:hypothetical protein
LAPAGQFRPQLPQFFGSASTLMQPPAQLTSGEEHSKPHAEAAHVGAPPAGAVQAFPQVPQFAGLVVTSTQAPLHDVSPPVQEPLQLPPVHTWEAPHGVPHAPQWFVSEARSTHAPLQSV